MKKKKTLEKNFVMSFWTFYKKNRKKSYKKTSKKGTFGWCSYFKLED